MRKEKVSHPLLLCVFAREQSPSVPTSVFLEERCPYSPSPVGLYYLGETPDLLSSLPTQQRQQRWGSLDQQAHFLELSSDPRRRHWAQERPLRGRSTLIASPQTWTAGTTIKLAPPWEGQTDRKTGSSGLRWKQKLNSPGLRRGDQRPAPTPGRWAETRKPRSLWLGPIPPREAPSLPAPRLPTATDAGKPPPPGEGSPGHRSRRCPPFFPPSLFLALPPSLPPSCSAARGALPRATCSGPNPGSSERDKKERTSYVEKKERKTFNCIYFSRSDPWWASVQTSRAQPCSCRGVRACRLAHAGRRAPRAVRCTLWAAAPAAQTPNRPQGPYYRLNLRLPASPLASAQEAAPLRLRPKFTHNPPCSCSRARPDTLPSQGAHWPPSGRGLARGCKPPPLHGTHTKPSVLTLPPAAPCPWPRCPSPAPEKGCISERAEAGRWARAEGAGEPRSQGGHRGSAG
ncbi:proline-rich protein 36-like [Pseudorca crassidens]|uniref:proline-rich protein 36-like n=1 Tax=Pseudorca crassidens TaxID=82174 RepID=UPI00352E471E